MGFSPKQERIFGRIMVAGVIGFYGGLIALAVAISLALLELFQ